MRLESKLICGDCLEIIPTLPRVKMIFADPPDNLGIKYVGFKDKIKNDRYLDWLLDVVHAGCKYSDTFWLSYNQRWDQPVSSFFVGVVGIRRKFIWHYTFGQNQKTDFVSSYRPIIRNITPGAIQYPDAVHVPSARQLKYNDKRANPKGKMPDDVWNYPRVCGTFKERKKWHPCQHPKELLKRMVLFSTKPGDTVVDMFAGSGNMFEVCKELDRVCIGVDISMQYCEQIADEQGLKIEDRSLNECKEMSN